MNLQIGIVGSARGWSEILRQEGAPFAEISGRPDPRTEAVVVVGGTVEGDTAAALRSYLNNGGAVIASTANASHLGGLRVKRTRVRVLYPHHEPGLGDLLPIDIDSNIDVVSGGNMLMSEKGIHRGYLGRVGNGHLLILPFEVEECLADMRSTVRSFVAPGARRPFERVSTVSRGTLRQFLVRCLSLMFNRRGLPYAHLWYYPGMTPTMVALRIDTDGATREQLDPILRWASSAGVEPTWFLDLQTQEPVLDFYRQEGTGEVALHCAEHRKYRDADDARKDITDGLARLRQAGFRPEGYAAPYGQWNAGIAAAIAENGFRYSSEFSYDYDNVPSRPLLDGGRTGALQVPVHPICIGTLKRHYRSEEVFSSYFFRVIDENVARHEPVFFYHHPSDGHLSILEKIFVQIREAGIPSTTMGAYARWWEKRTSAAPVFTVDRTTVTVNAEGGAPDLVVRVVRADGSERLVPVGTTCPLANPGWQAPALAAPPDDVLRVRRFNHRIPLIRGGDAVAGAALKLFRRR